MAEINPVEMKDWMLRLRNGNPEAFDKFLILLSDYYHDLMEKVVQAPAEEVMVAQGRAQGVMALLRMFKECTVEKKRRPLPFTTP